MRSCIALATCHEYADLDADDRLVLAPLAARGVVAEPAVWDDPSVDWGRFDAVVLRSTWDYPTAYDRFLAWAEAIPRLINPFDVVEWNTDKLYLLELEEAGMATVPTSFAGPGEPWTIPADWREVVVKPSTSAGSRDTARYDRTDPRVGQHIARLQAAGRMAMLQPYRHEVDEAGETGLVYIDGTFSHAFRKGPLLGLGGEATEHLFAPEVITGREPTAEELDLGAQVLRFVSGQFGTPVYARVDLLPGPMIIEVELTEPSLYLGYGAGAPDRLANAIAAALASDR